jgi:secreted trypsin-like serine protease
MLRFYPLTLALLLAAGVWFSSLTYAYYGNDDRQDIYELSGEDLEDADSVVALFHYSRVYDLGDGTAALLTVNYGEDCDLCPSERFQEQPSGAFCSGVLVAPDVIATAGHCIFDEETSTLEDFTALRFVFSFHMRDAATPELVINNRDIYSGAEVIAWKLDEHTGSDWALIRLDRTVVNHRVARIRESGTISDGQAVHIIGHPMGLPKKFAGNASVRDNQYPTVFGANLDAYPGNSGSPVFNSTTHEVEGILVGGEGGELVKQGDCYGSRVCSDAGCSGEYSTRTTEFAQYITWLQ